MLQGKVSVKKDQSAGTWNWQKEGTLIFGDSGCEPSELIASFDMDDTLISTKSGAKFAKNATDWKFWNDKVPEEIREYHNRGYRIVIFTNQRGISKGHTKDNDIKQKIEAVQKQVGVPFTALIASNDDEYAKPNVGMWKHFTVVINKDTQIKLKESVFIGDAAGRVSGKKKDFSDSDLQSIGFIISKFALNVGIPFKTPEQFFLKQDQNEDLASLITFDPKSIPKTGPLFLNADEEHFVKPESPELIILIGSVGSGKSTFVANHMKDYIRINRDTLKTKEKCWAKTEESMKEKKFIVIDNTNPGKDDRKPYIELAKKYKYPIRGFYLQVTKELAMHNDYQREVNKHRSHHSKKVGRIPIHSFFKNMEQPTKSEGFDDVRVVNFIAGPFENKQDEDTFFSFVKGKK